MRTLRPDHPRLLLLPSDLDRIRTVLRESSLARKVLADLEREADRLQSVPPVEYKLIGPRLLTQSRRALDRVYTLGLLYRLNGKRANLDRAVRELHAAASFKDWNPSHFLDVAEMTHALAIGYDWLYSDLSDEDRKLLHDAIVQKGLDPGLTAYRAPGSWAANRFNWNLVCNGGMVMGALAVAEDEAEKSAAVVKAAAESVIRGLASYGADGGWIEGPGYWDYGTRYAVMMLAALDSALGTDFGLANQPGFQKAGRFRIYFTGPTFKTFNYADAGEEAADEPAMFWLAKRFGQPVFAWQQAKLAERAKSADPLNLVWFNRDAKPPQVPQWPLDAIFTGVQCAFFRSSWDDPNALFLAVKGGDNKAPHGHLDLGSFVLDAGGVRWARDLGPDDYNLPGYFGKQRWNYYRMRTESHNTLLIDNENQDPKAEARIVRHEFGADASWVHIDLTRAYPGRVKSWQRRIGIVNRQAVLVEDTLATEQPVNIVWNMVTDAEVALDGQTAELTKEGWSLTAEIRTPRHAVFDLEPTKAPPPQAPNSGTRKLVVRVGERVTDLDLSVLLTPHRTGQPKQKITTKFPA
ncbi:MAG: heparinase II/III family protein [Acidobacteriota bacterium]|nr:heparinase II/III family protein [Acidobacteriota bacterium]